MFVHNRFETATNVSGCSSAAGVSTFGVGKVASADLADNRHDTSCDRVNGARTAEIAER